MKNTITINDLRKTLRDAWSRETAYKGDQERWTEDNPAIGQCAVTALVVQDVFGGDIYHGVGDGTSHYWNVINGAKVDLTESQFSFQPHFREIILVTREQILRSTDTLKRYEMLKNAIMTIDSSYNFK